MTKHLRWLIPGGIIAITTGVMFFYSQLESGNGLKEEEINKIKDRVTEAIREEDKENDLDKIERIKPTTFKLVLKKPVGEIIIRNSLKKAGYGEEDILSFIPVGQSAKKYSVNIRGLEDPERCPQILDAIAVELKNHLNLHEVSYNYDTPSPKYLLDDEKPEPIEPGLRMKVYVPVFSIRGDTIQIELRKFMTKEKFSNLIKKVESIKDDINWESICKLDTSAESFEVHLRFLNYEENSNSSKVNFYGICILINIVAGAWLVIDQKIIRKIKNIFSKEYKPVGNSTQTHINPQQSTCVSIKNDKGKIEMEVPKQIRYPKPNVLSPSRHPGSFDIKSTIIKCLNFKMVSEQETATVACGKINQWPVIIVSESVAEHINTTNTQKTIDNEENPAHIIIIEATQKYLNKKIEKFKDIDTVFECLKEAYDKGRIVLSEKNNHCKATLLIAFLYSFRGKNGDHQAFWFYAFKGDGAIVVINPARKINDKLVRTELLTPDQKIGDTVAAVSREYKTFPPMVGCMAYEPGDIMYVASDGMDEVTRTLLGDKKYRMHLASYLYNNLHEKLDNNVLISKLEGFQYKKDTVLGIIWTEKEV